ncbi:NLRC3 protein [Spatholobus suberectus]|nr:NLRC3 protein [Spatholobus suberectus]
MAEVPSLISLCIDALTQQLLRACDDLLPSIYDLPFHLLDTLITRLPPFPLRTFHHHLPFDEEGFSHDDSTKKRKRARDWNLNSAWQRLFQQRWPHRVKQIQIHPTDWQQLYWETHLQDCLDEAAEVALIPSFKGYIGDIHISDSILKFIGFVGNTSHSTCDHSKLSYHCLQFGSQVSCLRLQNVLCTAETSGLLRECKLQSLVLRCIRSKEQIDGLCKLIAQHCRTLTSLEFVHCTLSTDFINAIFGSLVIESVQKHEIQHLSIIASSFPEPCTVSLPSGLVSFLSSGRSLCSLKLSDNCHGRTFAKALFVTLLNLSSGISVLDLSANKIAGWLSDFNKRFLSGSHLSFGNGTSLKLLRVLNLRENNLQKDDAESLRYALEHVPNLEELDISDNSIEDEGIRNLIPYFVGASETCPHITCLKLENCDLSGVGVNHFLHVLSTFKGPLKSLSVADNYLGSQVAEALGKFLSTPIEVLDIAGIGLGSYGFQELQNLIKEEIKLVKINISKNRGGIETAKFLSKLLSQAPQLVDVNAASNLMPIESLAIICSALKFAKGFCLGINLQ